VIARLLIVASGFFLVSFGDTVYFDTSPERAPQRPQFGSRPPACGHLYNNGQHEAWAECMGVGYRSGEAPP
jgi:hypothetical protein